MRRRRSSALRRRYGRAQIHHVAGHRVAIGMHPDKPGERMAFDMSHGRVLAEGPQSSAEMLVRAKAQLLSWKQASRSAPRRAR